jgi:hypothetical protein
MAIATSRYGATDLRRLLANLQRVLETVDTAIRHVETSGEPLFVFKEYSQAEGLRQLLVFHDELVRSLIASQSGEPYNAGTLKPRSRGNSPGPQVSMPAAKKAEALAKTLKNKGIRQISKEELVVSEASAAESEEIEKQVDRKVKRESTRAKIKKAIEVKGKRKQG